MDLIKPRCQKTGPQPWQHIRVSWGTCKNFQSLNSTPNKMIQDLWGWGPNLWGFFCLVGWLINFFFLSSMGDSDTWLDLRELPQNKTFSLSPLWKLSPIFFAKRGPTAIFILQLLPSSLRGLLLSWPSPTNKRTDPFHSQNVEYLLRVPQ